jgi:hypothetical protein
MTGQVAPEISFTGETLPTLLARIENFSSMQGVYVFVESIFIDESAKKTENLEPVGFS